MQHWRPTVSPPPGIVNGERGTNKSPQLAYAVSSKWFDPSRSTTPQSLSSLAIAITYRLALRGHTNSDPIMVASTGNDAYKAVAANGNGKALLNRTKRRVAETNGDEKVAKRPRVYEQTDKTRWRMKDDCGRLTWHYLEDDEAAKEWPQTLADKWYLGLPLVRSFLVEWEIASANHSRPLNRISPNSPVRRNPSMLYGMASRFSKSSSCHPVSGVVNTVGPCSFFQALSSLGTSPRLCPRGTTRPRSRTISSLELTRRMAGGVCILRVKAPRLVHR